MPISVDTYIGAVVSPPQMTLLAGGPFRPYGGVTITMALLLMRRRVGSGCVTARGRPELSTVLLSWPKAGLGLA